MKEKSIFQKNILSPELIPNRTKKPWESDKNPYKIWIFEIIMQQTRLAQGMPYFIQFMDTFPTLESLAKADEITLFQVWKGLGYYSRARNIHKTAKWIFFDNQNQFPVRYLDLLKLSGVGSYTAAAIASFAFNEDVAVLDGNVYRVLARIFAREETIFSSKGKQFYFELANKLLPKGHAALFNQAMMDLGAEICTPQNPNCDACLMQSICKAFKQNKIDDFPVKKVATKLKDRFFHCVFIVCEDKVYVEVRKEKDIWQGLYQGVMIESETWNQKYIETSFGKFEVNSDLFSNWHIQKLSHVKAHVKFAVLQVKKVKNYENFIKKNDLYRLPFPKVINDFVLNNL